MAKNWYPVIDILSCMECGTCGSKCPQGAIAYVGDGTGWTPPALEGKEIVKADCVCGSTI